MHTAIRSTLTGLSILALLASGCSQSYRSKSGRVLNTELTVVSFASNNGEVAPCG